MKKRVLGFVLTAAMTVVLAGCGQASSASATEKAAEPVKEETAQAENKTEDAAGSGEVRKIRIASSSSAVPFSYYDENGNKTGYEIEVIKLVDEALPQYEFEYYDGEQEAIYTGLSTGKYDIALTNAYYTTKRAENYEIPENPIGASPAGLIVSKENADITSLEAAATAGLKPAPYLAGDGNTYQYQKYNEEHPDNQLELSYTSDENAFSNAIVAVAEGRYGCHLTPVSRWTTVIEPEDGALHEYYDKLSYTPVISISTFPIIAKGETQLTQDISEVLGQLKEDGTLEKIATEFYGFNPFDLNSTLTEG
ncbi:MAG: transporter substrate-binding domain-containing protein [Butyrivibrio sp.]|uniref:transporter substrate-binding domain-containing protein n=1 Tax=Butyrivibrio sp. TaxID=28121 RepID=UPI0025BB434D|nr:transporter substrate-binding domain-containing protein [Butyrivibrio sp.]MBQ6589244.1 transporter substrate-binding domain-containing protein [Butyrivibrio sp.]